MKYKALLVRWPAALCLFFLMFSAAACAGKAVQSFPWTDAQGRRLAFAAAGFSGAAGAEGVFSGESGQLAREFVLAAPLGVRAGEDIALGLRVFVPNLRCTVELRTKKAKTDSRSASPDKTRPLSGTAVPRASEFLLEPGYMTLRMQAGEGEILTGLKIVLKMSGAASSPAQGAASASLASLQRIALGPALRGFRRGMAKLPDQSDAIPALEVSSNFSMHLAQGLYEVSIAQPFDGFSLDASSDGSRAALVIEYSGTSASDIVVQSPEAAKILVQAAKPAGRVIIPAVLLGTKSSAVSIRFPLNVQPKNLYASILPKAEAELLDLGTIVLMPPSRTSPDYDVYRWSELPEVVVLDFRDYATQDSYLKRLAFFVEKDGFRGRLASDAEIKPLHGWNAHDYRPQDLAAFFNAAQAKNFPLHAQEKTLSRLLVERGILLDEAGALAGSRFKAGKGAIISITREAPDYLRRTFVSHESMHGIFFSDAAYREFCISIWNSMSKEERWFWYLYFGWMHYDRASPYLMANEIQAYLMQQPIHGVRKYFTEVLPSRVLQTNPELKQELDAYMKTFGDTFELRARSLDAWIRAAYGFRAGRTFFVR